MTQGRATFSMEFACYRRTPAAVQEDIIAQARTDNDKDKAAAKR
jgi:translation elongation factor EF-G